MNVDNIRNIRNPLISRSPLMQFGYFFTETTDCNDIPSASIHNLILVAFHVVNTVLREIFPVIRYIQTALIFGYFGVMGYKIRSWLLDDLSGPPEHILGMAIRALFMTFTPLLLLPIDFGATILQEPSGSLICDISNFVVGASK
ncbi:MAG: hypothetical protein AAGF04_04690 [Chlamydiota bacterium]